MTTIKSIIGWMFGIYRDSKLLQVMLLAFISMHFAVFLILYVAWLLRFIARLAA